MINENFRLVEDALDADGFSIPIETVLEPDASPGNQQMKEVWGA